MRKILLFIILLQITIASEEVKEFYCIESTNNGINESDLLIKKYLAFPEKKRILVETKDEAEKHADIKKYDDFEILNPDYSHFYCGSNKEAIEDIFNKNNISTVVEIGSWTGAGSTKHIGELLKKHTKGKLYAVDTWLGSIEHQEGERLYDPILENLYEQFLSNLIHFDLTEFIIPCKMTSLEAAEKLNVNPDLLYLDGDHSTESVYNDLKAWYPLMKENGVICGDDWGWESVNIAVRLFAKDYGFKIEAHDNFWLLQK